MWRIVALAIAGLTLLIARSLLLPPGPTAVRAEEAAPADDTPVARGRLLYHQYGCVMCHGEDGKGGRENLNAETEGKVPGVVKVAEGYTEAELVRLLRRGTARIGKADAAGPVPPYRMPGWGDRLTDDQLRDLVRYLVSLAPPPAKGWR